MKFYYFYIGGSVGWEPSNYTWLDLQDQFYATAADSTVHDITTQDLGVSAWIKLPAGVVDDTQPILSKNQDDQSGPGYCLMADKKDCLWLLLYDDESYNFTMVAYNIGIVDDNWHHVAAIVDRDNANNCLMFVDGVRVATSQTGVIANVGTLTNNGTLHLGRFSFVPPTYYYLDGQIREVILTYPADIMAAGEMGAPGEIFNLANTFFEKDSYCNYEDYWACNDGAGTTIAGVNNDLTLTSANAWFLR